jgi:hypothetical protein
VVSFAADEVWDAILGVKTNEAGMAVAAVGGGGWRCPLLPPLFYWRMKNSLFVPRRRRHFSF